ncbi:thyrotropin subunit beta-like [Latimeria chalumnae]|uniref:thyrotropin subunit beta-like n=1 Tax=Latimeria chalumnae TaxID=7897 RepID=UPI0003C14E8C|nr:PREDICTED: thyrotropin subunit beta-like [Latimeria chalumnae]|eukprot:XP_006002637.1 PREDICTED: thyrotropin subunit beta-like [Latimeria chalumnae]
MNFTWLVPVVICMSCTSVNSLCTVTRYMMYVEKEQCSHCIAINTTICSGYCITRDPNLKALLPRTALSQSVCTYNKVKYLTIRIPGCAPHIDPYYRFAVAINCKCSLCNTDSTDCTNEGENPNECNQPQWRIPAMKSRLLLI